MKADISAVVPLYNAKNYVKLTIDSILNQTHKSVEIVIVDDCSTDGSLDFCRELYGHDERVKFLQQPHNMGPGAARNAGIRSATGEYVALIDSDDEILPDTFSKMLETAKKFNADIVNNTQFMFPLPNEEGKIPLQLISDDVDLFPLGPEHNFYSGVTLLSDDLASRFEKWLARQIRWSVCSKIFRRKFILDNGICFADMKLAEDMVFCFECLFKSKNYVVLPGGGYVYRILDTSLSRGKKSSANVIKALKSQIEIVAKMRNVLSGIPFFVENPDKARMAIERILDDVESVYVRPAFQELGEDGLRSDNLVSDFMRENFGDNAPYVEFLFYELHKNYEPIADFFAQMGNIETWKNLAKQLREKEQGK